MINQFELFEEGKSLEKVNFYHKKIIYQIPVNIEKLKRMDLLTENEATEQVLSAITFSKQVPK